MTLRRKPETIEAGRCYRLRSPYDSRAPGDRVVYALEISGVKQRWVMVTGTTLPDDGVLAWPYGEFLRRVWSEEPVAKQ